MTREKSSATSTQSQERNTIAFYLHTVTARAEPFVVEFPPSKSERSLSNTQSSAQVSLGENRAFRFTLSLAFARVRIAISTHIQTDLIAVNGSVW